MTGYEVDTLVEAAAARQWEEHCEPSPYEGIQEIASRFLDDALYNLDKAIDYVTEAADEMEYLKVGDELTGIAEMLTDTLSAIRHHRDRLRRGEC